jgi:hypothetical protein
MKKLGRKIALSLALPKIALDELFALLSILMFLIIAVYVAI